MRKTSLACAAFVGALLCLPSLAGSDKALSINVGYGDLNIARPADAQILLGRIKSAADQVCGGPGSHVVVASPSDYMRCKIVAVEGAVRQINSPLVASLYGKPDLVAAPVSRVASSR